MTKTLAEIIETLTSQSKNKFIAENKIKDLQLEIDKLDQQFSEVAQELGQKQELARDKKKYVDGLELEAKELSEIEKSIKGKMDVVVKHKELEGLQRELETAQERRSLIEDQLVKSWSKFEQASAQVETFKKEVEAKEAEKEAQVQKFTDEIVKVKEEISPVDKIINQAIDDLPEELKKKFLQIQAKNIKQPITKVSGNSCSMCYYPVPTKFFTLLRKNGISSCQNCYRILYFVPEEKQA